MVDNNPSVSKLPPWMLPLTLNRVDTCNMVAMMLGPVILPVEDMIAAVILPTAMLAAMILPVLLIMPEVERLPA